MADDNAAPDEEMIEKPREPMFSKSGWIVLFGSNIVIGALIFVVVLMLTSAGNKVEEKDAMDAQKTMKLAGDEDNYMEVTGCVAHVIGAGQESHKVSWDFAVAYDTPDQTGANNHFAQEGRPMLLKSIAQDLMGTYRYDEVTDGNFKKRYEQDLKERYNTRLTKFKVKTILLMTPNVQ